MNFSELRVLFVSYLLDLFNLSRCRWIEAISIEARHLRPLIALTPLLDSHPRYSSFRDSRYRPRTQRLPDHCPLNPSVGLS